MARRLGPAPLSTARSYERPEALPATPRRQAEIHLHTSWPAMTDEIRLCTALVCDDVRREENGKEIIIGLYGQAVVVSALPATIPLCLWARFESSTIGGHEIELSVVRESGEEILHGVSIMLQVRDPSDVSDVSLNGIMVKQETPGTVRFRWREKGQDQWKDMISVRIRPGTVRGVVSLASPIAAPPPPEQPPSSVPETSSEPEPSHPGSRARRRHS